MRSEHSHRGDAADHAEPHRRILPGTAAHGRGEISLTGAGGARLDLLRQGDLDLAVVDPGWQAIRQSPAPSTRLR